MLYCAWHEPILDEREREDHRLSRIHDSGEVDDSRLHVLDVPEDYVVALLGQVMQKIKRVFPAASWAGRSADALVTHVAISGRS